MKDVSSPVDVKQGSIPAYWIIGLFVFVNTMICYFDRVNFSVAAPAIMKQFNWDIGIMGLAMSMFGVGYILTQIPAGLLADRFGAKPHLGGKEDAPILQKILFFFSKGIILLNHRFPSEGFSQMLSKKATIIFCPK